jgi:hypothetical protein
MILKLDIENDNDPCRVLSTALGVAHRVGIPVQVRLDTISHRPVVVLLCRWDELLKAYDLLDETEFRSGSCAWAPAKTCCALSPFSDTKAAWCLTCQSKLKKLEDQQKAKEEKPTPMPAETARARSAEEYLSEALDCLGAASAYIRPELKGDLDVLGMYIKTMIEKVSR